LLTAVVIEEKSHDTDVFFTMKLIICPTSTFAILT